MTILLGSAVHLNGLGVVMLIDDAVGGGRQIDNGVEDAAFGPALGESGNEAPIALSHEQEVGVKWHVKRRCRSSHARTAETERPQTTSFDSSSYRSILSRRQTRVRAMWG